MSNDLLKPFNVNELSYSRVELPASGDSTLVLKKAVELGSHSSKRDHHYKHDDLTYATFGSRCGACRWFEVKLLRTDDDYVIWTCGRTIVPNERDRITIQRTPNEYQVIEYMTVRKPNNVFLPQPSAHVLADAAKLDEGILDAYVNRVIP